MAPHWWILLIPSVATAVLGQAVHKACQSKTCALTADDTEQNYLAMLHHGAVKTRRGSGALSGGAATSTASPCGFEDFFEKQTTGPGIHKWLSYFPTYEEHFGRYCNPARGRNVRMMEIGIQSGGSMMMWRHGFGDNLDLFLGLDIDPATKAWEQFGDNVKVAIGSQADPVFLSEVKENYSKGFDIISDDGSHIPNHVFITFVSLWPLVRPGGVYLIEDIHGTNPVPDWLFHGHEVDGIKWNGLLYSTPDGNIGAADTLKRGGQGTLNQWDGSAQRQSSSEYQAEIASVKVYPYMLAITKRESPLEKMEAVKHGSTWIPYQFKP